MSATDVIKRRHQQQQQPQSSGSSSSSSIHNGPLACLWEHAIRRRRNAVANALDGMGGDPWRWLARQARHSSQQENSKAVNVEQQPLGGEELVALTTDLSAGSLSCERTPGYQFVESSDNELSPRKDADLATGAGSGCTVDTQVSDQTDRLQHLRF